MTHRPHDHDPAMEAWHRLHDALSRLGHEIIAPVRPLIVTVLDGLLGVLQRLGIHR
jgi:hypothetical protein